MTVENLSPTFHRAFQEVVAVGSQWKEYELTFPFPSEHATELRSQGNFNLK